MLSFDITDRNIRFVKGVESNGKIKISSAATLNIDENLIVNGHVKDAPAVATAINSAIKMHKMPDKEAIVSISSNLTIFKEMTVAKVKNQELQKVVKQQMQAELNLDDTYSVSYIIVGDAEATDGNNEPAYKILATACPNEIINSYRDVFKLLGISLRSLMIGCNCITKVLLADTKIRSKMPLLAVQIDNNFISLNLYERGQLSFSRFASIDASDYGYSPDYVFEAVNENIFRMLQFHRSRNTGEVIENVIFYGDTKDYVRLTDELEKLDLKTSLINVPPQIHGHENLEFSLYANAIGAMFKRNKEIEKINLLETDLGTAVKNKIKNDSSGNLILGGLVVVSLAVAGIGFVVQNARLNGVKKDIEDVQDFINSDDTQNKLKHHADLLDEKAQVEAYYNSMNNAYASYRSQPVINGEKFDVLRETLNNAGVEETKNKDVKLEKRNFPDTGFIYDNGIISIDIECGASESMAQEYPTYAVRALLKAKTEKGKKPIFGAATYAGYTVEEPVVKEGQTASPDDEDVLKYNITLQLNGRESAYVEPETEESAENN
ncbi:MAG: pilus assembly protein PilM [Ruminococcus sp.]|nr:pilus assembly protein PilM [Ruminococcus sp.]